jgi:acetoin utilization deacetylase AcuC-like enzyme
VERREAPLASPDLLELAHDRLHVASVLGLAEEVRQQEDAGGTELVYIDPDTAMNRHSWNAALRGAGAAIAATDAVMAGELENAFCAVRPPGHHATRNRAMGFCIFNNVAVAARYALERHGLQRVAVADFDVHHGNGTEDILSNDPRVLMVGIFQHPFYPYSGADDPARNMINVPLPAGAGSREFREAVTEAWLPALDDFAPELVVFSAGFDAHMEDDMAMLRFADADYGWVTQQVKAIADRHAKGRIVSALEGGYALSALGRSAVQHIRALGGLNS